jgi:hypothetical protein
MILKQTEFIAKKNAPKGASQINKLKKLMVSL